MKPFCYSKVPQLLQNSLCLLTRSMLTCNTTVLLLFVDSVLSFSCIFNLGYFRKGFFWSNPAGKKYSYCCLVVIIHRTNAFIASQTNVNNLPKLSKNKVWYNLIVKILFYHVEKKTNVTCLQDCMYVYIHKLCNCHLNEKTTLLFVFFVDEAKMLETTKKSQVFWMLCFWCFAVR